MIAFATIYAIAATISILSSWYMCIVERDGKRKGDVVMELLVSTFVSIIPVFNVVIAVILPIMIIAHSRWWNSPA